MLPRPSHAARLLLKWPAACPAATARSYALAFTPYASFVWNFSNWREAYNPRQTPPVELVIHEKKGKCHSVDCMDWMLCCTCGVPALHPCYTPWALP